MKRPDPHALLIASQEASNAVAHLTRSLVRERHGEDSVRRDAVLLNQVTHPRREHPRLSRTRAR